MQTIIHCNELTEYLAFQKAKGKTVGLVPTMGALHEGHLSLIRRSAAENDLTVVSVFVNPTQFGAGEDFEAYPRDLAADGRAAAAVGADLLFAPAAADMYPAGHKTSVHVADLSAILCGASRPGHFDGVATVVCKLFHIALPDRAYFGEKDAQQLLLVRRMVQDLNMNVAIVGCPIVREEDGLAKSSRNAYLNADERGRATALYRSLQLAREMVEQGERRPDVLREAMREHLAAAHPTTIDYIELVRADTLEPVAQLAGPILIALAVRFGTTRLIDNITLEV